MLNFFKYLLIALLVVFGAWLGYFYYQHQRMPRLDELQSSVQQIPSLLGVKAPVSSSALPKIDELNQQAFSNALAQGKERVDKVLGEAIEVASESDKPATQKALDYGRYLYCQQVVTEYEKK